MVMEVGAAFSKYVLVTHTPPGRQQAPNPTVLLQAERGNPVSLPSGTAVCKDCPWRCGHRKREKANAAL